MGVVRVELVPKGAAPDRLAALARAGRVAALNHEARHEAVEGRPSYVPDAAKAKKLNEHLGAVSHRSSTLRSPSCVWSVTAIFSLPRWLTKCVRAAVPRATLAVFCTASRDARRCAASEAGGVPGHCLARRLGGTRVDVPVPAVRAMLRRVI